MPADKSTARMPQINLPILLRRRGSCTKMCRPLSTSSTTMAMIRLVVVSILVAMSLAKMARLHATSTNIMTMPK